MVTPATRPSSRCSTLVEVCRSTLSVLTLEAAPVKSLRSCVWYPVTTTSGSTEIAGSRVTLTLDRPATLCALPRYPIRLNTRTASGGTATVYFPCASVTVLVLLPRTRTVTPDTGLPPTVRSEEHTSELQSQSNLVCRLLLEKKKQCVTFPRVKLPVGG